MRCPPLIATAYAFFAACPSTPAAEPWRDLFNGRDLAGWETWLRATHEDGGEHGEPIGLNQDPRGVFTVIEGGSEPGVLRVSGEVFGCVSSLESFSDCHVRFDFRWGEKKWPPRVDQKRDSGFLYHCVGEHGAFWNAWKRCVECQVQEGDVGDFFYLAGTRGRSPINPADSPAPPAKWRFYDPAGSSMSDPGSGQVVHSGLHESPGGQWNTVQVVLRGDTGVHLVNGFVVNRGFDYAEETTEGFKPLTAGQFQFQSEAAELYYRRIQVRPAPAKSAEQGVSLAGMTPNMTSVSTASTVAFRNTGAKPVDIVGVELYGPGADAWSATLPETPAVIAPRDSFVVAVKPNGDGRASLRLEGMDGPARAVVELISE